MIGAAVCGVFGAGVAKHLSPYGANDPATQSVQATNRFQAAAGRADRRRHRRARHARATCTRAGPATQRRVAQVAAQLQRRSPTSRSVVSFFDHPNPAMVSRDRRSTYVLAYFKPLSDQRLKDDAQQIERPVRRPARRDARWRSRSPTRRRTLRSATTSRTPSCSPSRSSSCSRCCSSARSSRRCCRRCSAAWRSSTTFLVLRIVANFVDLSVFALNLVTGLGLGLAIDYSLFMVSRYREEAAPVGLRPPGAAPHAPDRRAHDPVQLAHGRRGDRVAGDLPAAVPVLDGDRRRARRAARGDAGAARAARAARGARAARQRARAEAAAARRRPRRPARGERRLVPALAVRDAAAGTDRGGQRDVPDRARAPVLRDQVHHRQRERPAARARAHARSTTRSRSSFPPNRTRRSRSSSARPPATPQVQALPHRAAAASGRVGRLAGAAGRQRPRR